MGVPYLEDALQGSSQDRAPTKLTSVRAFEMRDGDNATGGLHAGHNFPSYGEAVHDALPHPRRRHLPILSGGGAAREPGRDPDAAQGESTASQARGPATPQSFPAREWPRLTDGRGRQYSYLRLSVTDRCDLACTYCMPPQGESDHTRRVELLTFEEIVRLASVVRQMGIEKIRLTGGEPLVRKDLPLLVKALRDDAGIDNIQMTSNATRFAHFAQPLKDAGLRGVNISIDSLEPERFAKITRGGKLHDVLAGMDAALDAGLSVKLNSVLIAGENDHEAEALVRFAWSKNITPRFIELMPLGAGQALARSALVSNGDLMDRLREPLDLGQPADTEAHAGPAHYLHSRTDQARKVGFISARSGNFCDSCNRVRITASGDMRACLASRHGVSLRDLMRSGATDRDLAFTLHWALSTKYAGHQFDDAPEGGHTEVGMSLVGG